MACPAKAVRALGERLSAWRNAACGSAVAQACPITWSTLAAKGWLPSFCTASAAAAGSFSAHSFSFFVLG
jgi:hypothetical protein